MPFKTLLAQLIASVPGARGAIVTDWEGEAVDQVGLMDTYDLQVMGAHKGVVLQSLGRVASRLGNDRLTELVITTSRVQTLVLPVTSEYFLLLACDRNGTLGRARFEARRCLQALHREIA
jgi:predicted regulator of Ras-like GTPase activity (Roadblock/LC7/MglB family)